MELIDGAVKKWLTEKSTEGENGNNDYFQDLKTSHYGTGIEILKVYNRHNQCIALGRDYVEKNEYNFHSKNTFSLLNVIVFSTFSMSVSYLEFFLFLP